jgi:hypothetical protein
LPIPPEVDRLDPAERIELVILDPIVISAESLRESLPTLPIQLSFPINPIGTIEVSVATLQVGVKNGTVSLSATGTASTSVLAPFIPRTSSFEFSQPIHIAPAFSMAPNAILEASPQGAPSLSLPNLVGTFVGEIAPLVSSSLSNRAVLPLVALLNTLVVTSVTTALGVAALPSGAVLSIRELTTDVDSITVTPVLGAFGTVLSDYQPSAVVVVPRLAGLLVQPTSIATSDPASRTAQGRATLDGPAPAGGVTIQLSCDRADVMQVLPASLAIPEGATEGTFTITGNGQPILGSEHIDGTVQAALGSQTVTATLSIKPEPPATVAPPVSVPVTPPSTGKRGIASISLLSPQPIPRGQTIQGQIMLDGQSLGTVPVVVVLMPPVVPPIQVQIPVGFNEAYFTFSLGASFPGNTLQITATTDAGASTKSIEVAVGM